MPEREGVQTLTPEARRKRFVKARVELHDALQDDEADHLYMNRSTRRAMQRELVKDLRRGKRLE